MFHENVEKAKEVLEKRTEILVEVRTALSDLEKIRNVRDVVRANQTEWSTELEVTHKQAGNVHFPYYLSVSVEVTRSILSNEQTRLESKITELETEFKNL